MRYSSVQPRYAVASMRITEKEKTILLARAKKARKPVSELLFEAAIKAGLLTEEGRKK